MRAQKGVCLRSRLCELRECAEGRFYASSVRSLLKRGFMRAQRRGSRLSKLFLVLCEHRDEEGSRLSKLF